MVQAVSRLWGQGACGSGQRDRMAGDFQAATRTASAVSYPCAGADSSEGSTEDKLTLSSFFRRSQE